MKTERANRLYELRREKRVTQTAVGLAVHVSQSQISGYERGKEIPYNTLLRLAKYFGVTPEYIMKETDDRTGIQSVGLSEDERSLVSFRRHLKGDYKKLFDGIVFAFKNFSDSKL